MPTKFKGDGKGKMKNRRDAEFDTINEEYSLPLKDSVAKTHPSLRIICTLGSINWEPPCE